MINRLEARDMHVTTLVKQHEREVQRKEIEECVERHKQVTQLLLSFVIIYLSPPDDRLLCM